MSKRSFKFVSVAKPTWRYRLHQTDDDNPAYDWRRGQYCLDSRLSTYDTMGDGEVQHSPDCLVPTDDVADVVESLGCNLHNVEIDLNTRNGSDDDGGDANAVCRFWRCEPSMSDDVIRFAQELKYNEKKDTYYTFNDGCKKSFSENKRHDKRWHRIERPRDQQNEIDRILSLTGVNGGYRTFGCIQLVATVMRIAEVLDKGSCRWDAIKNLQDGSVFKSLERDQMWQFITNFERITAFKQGVELLQFSRCASIGHLERQAKNTEAASL